MFLQARNNFVPAHLYPTAKGDLDLDLIAFLKTQAASGAIDLLEKQVAEVTLQPESEPEPENHEEEEAEDLIQNKSASADRIDVEDVNITVAPSSSSPVPQVAVSPAPISPKSPAKSPIREDTFTNTVSVTKSSPPVSTKKPSRDEEDDRDLDDLLEEEEELLNKTPSPVKQAPIPTPAPTQITPVVSKPPVEEEDDEELNLDDLDDDNNNSNNIEKDVLEQEDEGFDSNEDW